jgi:hypothetical protein
MRKTRAIYVLTLGLGVLGSAGGLAAGHETALGSDGEVYAVRTGAYKDLFPGGKDFDRDNKVVALEITKPGVAAQRLLVPGTGGSEVENSPSVLFEDDSQTVFLLWESEMNIHPSLKLAAFDGSTWSKPIEVMGNPFALKSSPQFTITRDSYEVVGADNLSVTRHRTLLHLIWQEQSTAGTVETFYSPIVILDGAYIGWTPVYNLEDYLQDRVTTASDVQVQPSLARAPLVQSGRDERTIVVGFASTRLGKVVTVEIDVLPEQLIQLAEGARAHIVDLGRELYPTDLPNLAEKARAHIVDLGRAFRPEVINSIADQVKALILAGGTESLQAIGEKARAHIVDLGAQLSDRGLRGVNGADATAKIVRLDEGQGQESPTPIAPTDTPLLQFRIVSNFAAPVVGQGAVRLFVSQTGDNVIVSWALPDRVAYRVNKEDGWSDSKELRFSDNLTLAKAYDILDQRVRNR